MVSKFPTTKKRSGFTLPELIVVAAIISLLTLLVTAMLSNSLKSYRFGQASIKMQDVAAKSVREFESKARYAETIEEASPTSFTFKAYIANDSRPAPTLIQFVLEEDRLIRYMTFPFRPEGQDYYIWQENPDDVKIIATGIQNASSTETPLFEYYSDQNYDYAYPDTTKLFPEEAGFSVSLIKMVRISLRIDFDTQNVPEEAVETTLVSLRNLKSNL